MPDEEEKRLHRCCFSGQRPEKLDASEADVKQWLEEQIDRAVAEGYLTFISGCGMGVDLWAGQIVLKKKERDPALHLIAAFPWPGFPSRWNAFWRGQFDALIRNADLALAVSDHYHEGVFRQRNEWLVNHSHRLIACFNGAPGGTKDMIDYARSRQIEVVTLLPSGDSASDEKRRPEEDGPSPAP